MKVRAPWLALVALCVAGCSVDSLLNQSERQSEKASETVCACTNVFPDRAACEAQFGSFLSFSDRDCVEDALEADKEASRETLKCTVKALKEYNRCLEDMLDCNDSTSLEGCQSFLQNDCPALPQSVQTALSACGKDESE